MEENSLFEEWLSLRGYGPASKKTYRSMFGAFSTWLADRGASLRDVGTSTLQQFFEARGITNGTERRYLILLRDFFDHLVEQEKFELEDNPALRLLRLREKQGKRTAKRKRLPVALTDAETGRLTVSLPTEPMSRSNRRRKAIILTLLGCGLRVTELCELKWPQVDIDSADCTIRVIGKGDKERLVPIPDDVVLALQHWRDCCEKDAKATGPLTSYVFAKGRFDLPYSASGIFKLVKTALVAAEIVKARLSPHVLRHTFATRNLAAGIPLATVKLWLGHDHITTTAIYEHVTTTPEGQKPRGVSA